MHWAQTSEALKIISLLCSELDSFSLHLTHIFFDLDRSSFFEKYKNILHNFAKGIFLEIY